MKIKINPITGDEFYYEDSLEFLKGEEEVELMELGSRTMLIAKINQAEVGLITLPYEQLAVEELDMMRIAKLNIENVIGLDEDSEVEEQIIIRKEFKHIGGQTVYLTELTLDGFTQFTILTEEAILWTDV